MGLCEIISETFENCKGLQNLKNFSFNEKKAYIGETQSSYSICKQFISACIAQSSPAGSDGKESTYNAGGWEDPLEKAMATHSSILA